MTAAQLALPIDAPAPDWNPRYVAYARAHGRGPEEMLELDRERYPGACMMDFSLWIGEQWAAFRRARRLGRDGYGEDGEFDAWLAANPSISSNGSDSAPSPDLPGGE